jgi:hypothetical protein
MSTTANCRECFTECIGKKVVGVLFDALPLYPEAIAKNTKTLVFHDKTGLTVAGNGSYWQESESDIARAVERKVADLRKVTALLTNVLEVAGYVGEPPEDGK